MQRTASVLIVSAMRATLANSDDDILTGNFGDPQPQLDGEAVIARDNRMPDFRALWSPSRGHEAVLFAFDLIELDGDDLRDLPLIDRKRRPARLIGRAKHGVKDAAPPGSSPDRNG